MHRTEGYSVCRLRCVSLGALCISSFLLMSHMSYLQICLSIWTQTVKFAWWDSIRENDTLHCCWGLFYALGTRQSCHLSFLALRNWVALLKQHVDDRQPTNRHCPNEAVLFSIPYSPLLSLSSCCSLYDLCFEDSVASDFSVRFSKHQHDNNYQIWWHIDCVQYCNKSGYRNNNWFMVHNE